MPSCNLACSEKPTGDCSILPSPDFLLSTSDFQHVRCLGPHPRSTSGPAVTSGNHLSRITGCWLLLWLLLHKYSLPSCYGGPSTCGGPPRAVAGCNLLPAWWRLAAVRRSAGACPATAGLWPDRPARLSCHRPWRLKCLRWGPQTVVGLDVLGRGAHAASRHSQPARAAPTSRNLVRGACLPWFPGLTCALRAPRSPSGWSCLRARCRPAAASRSGRAWAASAWTPMSAAAFRRACRCARSGCWVRIGAGSACADGADRCRHGACQSSAASRQQHPLQHTPRRVLQRAACIHALQPGRTASAACSGARVPRTACGQARPA